MHVMPTATTAVAPVLGRVLKLARKARNQSQDAVGEALGTTQSTVSAWENGHLRPSLEQLVMLRAVLAIDRGALWDAVETELAADLPDELPVRGRETADA